MIDYKKNIVWIVSYPKSGNTWFRILLSYMVWGVDHELDINALRIPMATDRKIFENMCHLISSEMTECEIDRLRPDIYRQIACSTQDQYYFKVHEAFRNTPDGNELFPAEVTRVVIYLIRNPLDIVSSFSNHLGVDLDQTIYYMGNNFALFHSDKNCIHQQFPQPLKSWSGHVESWTLQEDLPVYLVRYEDLLQNPFSELRRIADKLELNVDDEKIKKAIELSRFEKLQQQEKEFGFREKPNSCGLFFNHGRAGIWQKILNNSQITKVVKNHNKMMRKFGYESFL